MANIKPLLANGSIAYMLAQYRFTFNEVNGLMRYFGPNPNTQGQNVLKSPIYGSLSGIILLDGRVQHALGAGTIAWSSTSSDSASYASEYIYDPTLVSPSAFDGRYYGNSLRRFAVWNHLS